LQLYNVLDFKNALTVSHQGQRSMDIKQLQRSESTMMMMLNEITVKDAIGVKILTILATLYLPASFVAVSAPYGSHSKCSTDFYTDFLQTFLSADLVTFDQSRSKRKSVDFHRMVISRESVIFYIAVTIPLMVLTYGCWWIWQKKASRTINARLNRSKTEKMGSNMGGVFGSGIA
jgi:hypothetical protein